jgi:hypothetical protein
MKGETDIRMVYNGTKSGLNDCLWEPWFPLPTIDTMLRSVTGGTWMSDNDVGEMFLNFMLHEEVRKLCGVDFTLYFPDELTAEHEVLWGRWTRCAMGLRTSPYQAVQAMLWAQEIILGNKDDPDNVFRWSTVILNLPGSENYDPTLPWVCKLRMDGILAADVHCYVDDVRTTANTKTESWLASQRTSSVLAYLGLQDAPRKGRGPMQDAGAWAGSVVHTLYGSVVQMVSQEKWDKTRSHLSWIADHVERNAELPYARLLSIRGFLIYVTRTYPMMKPYLKGTHATIDSWRPGRDEDGWRLKNKRNRVDDSYLNELLDDDDCMEQHRYVEQPDGIENDVPSGYQDAPPETVAGGPRLKDDIQALIKLSEFEEPPTRLVRASKTALVGYGFGDASGLGFGVTVLINGALIWKGGVWNRTIKEESSNY